jgi:hypothetical protein
MLIALIIIILLLGGFGGGFYGYNHYGPGPGLGILGTVLVIALIIYLLR